MILPMTLPCRIVTDRQQNCLGIETIHFRAYLGHLNRHEVTVAIRHLTEREARYGISYLTSCYWMVVDMHDARLKSDFRVLVNIASLRKRLLAANLRRDQVNFCIGHKNFSSLMFIFHEYPSLPYTSLGIFKSHSPLMEGLSLL